MAPHAIPSQLPNCPVYLSKPDISKRLSREETLQLKENESIAKAFEQSTKEFQEQQAKDNCTSLIDVVEKLQIDHPWHLIKHSGGIKICYIENLSNSCPQVKTALCLNEDMLLNVFVQSVKLSKIGSLLFPMQITKLSQIYQTCETVCSLKSFTATSEKRSFDLTLQLIISLLISLKPECEKFETVLSFVIDQLQLMTKRSFAYPYEFLIFASILQNISPSAYRFLRSSGNLILPCLSTIRKVTLHSTLSPSNEQSDETFLFYITQKFKALQACDKTVNLLIDEIHLSSFFDYKGGTIVGSAHDNINAATSAFAFMVTSIFSNYKDVVHVLPARKIDAQLLFEIIKKTINSLEKIGFRVISVITDNNAINRKAMSSYVSPPKLSVTYPHPSEPTRPLFFILDSVHILKCARNNWLNQKNIGKCFTFPPFQFGDICTSQSSDVSASFSSLKELHQMESDYLIKYAY